MRHRRHCRAARLELRQHWQGGAGAYRALAVREWRSKSVPLHPSALPAANVPSSILRSSRLRGGASDLETLVESEIVDILSSLALLGIAPSRAQQPRADATTSTTSVVPTITPDGSAVPPLDTPPVAPPAAAPSGGGATLADLWQVRRQLTLGLGLLVLQQLIGINTIMYYSVSILVRSPAPMPLVTRRMHLLSSHRPWCHVAGASPCWHCPASDLARCARRR